MSALTLYYGRLALLEPAMSLALAVAAIAAIRADGPSIRRWAVVCGVALGLALGLKANALASMVGILGAIAILSIKTPGLCRFIWITLGVVAAEVVAWLLAVALPNMEAIRRTLVASDVAAIPASLGEWLSNVRHYATSNDGLVPLAWPVIMAAVIGAIIVAWDHLRGGSHLRGSPSAQARVALIGASWASVGLLGVASFSYWPDRYVVPLLPGLALVVGAAVSVADRRAVRQSKTVRRLAIATLVTVLAVPGVVAAADWATSTGRTEVEGQAAVEAIVPPGAQLAGPYAALFAMRLPVTTIITLGGLDAEPWRPVCRWCPLVRRRDRRPAARGCRAPRCLGRPTGAVVHELGSGRDAGVPRLTSLTTKRYRGSNQGAAGGVIVVAR
jgi:hypothetical protein